MRVTRPAQTTRRIAVAFLVIMFAAACSSGAADEAGPTILGAGEIQVELPDNAPASQSDDDVAATSEAADDAGDADTDTDTDPADSAEAADDQDADDDAIPLNEQDTTIVEQADVLFDSIDIFNRCLDDEGREFIGVPSAETPEGDPSLDPSYIASLQKCAAESNIQEAFASNALSSDGLSADEIANRNAGYVYFEECLVVRGWTLGEALPDENGLLEVQPGEFDPPPGESILDTDDLRECLALASERVEAEAGTAE